MFRKLNYPITLLIVIICIILLWISFNKIDSNIFAFKNPTPNTNYTYDIRNQLDKFAIDLDLKDPKEVYRQVKIDSKNLTYSEKHELAHLFGKALFLSKGEEGIRVCDTDLNFGCYHGLFIEAILNEGISEVSRLDQICQSLGIKAYTACQHGIGHGLMEYFGKLNINKALDECDLIQKKYSLIGCSSGVFMEYFSNDYFVSAESYKDNAFEVCNSINPRFRDSCLFELPRLWRIKEPNLWKINEPDFPNALVSRCLELSNENDQKFCFRGIGYSTGNSLQVDPKFSLQICGHTKNMTTKLYCLSGATWFYMTLQNGSPKALNTITNLCKESFNESACRNLSNLRHDLFSQSE